MKSILYCSTFTIWSCWHFTVKLQFMPKTKSSGHIILFSQDKVEASLTFSAVLVAVVPALRSKQVSYFRQFCHRKVFGKNLGTASTYVMHVIPRFLKKFLFINQSYKMNT